MSGFINGKLALDSSIITTEIGQNHDVPVDASLIYMVVSGEGDEITGFSLGENIGAFVLVVNSGVEDNDLILKHNDSGSLLENRIITADGQDYVVKPFETAILGYNVNTEMWHILRVPDAPPTGSIEMTLEAAPPTGWLFLQGGTIGDDSSGATVLASWYAEELFEFLWDNLSDSEAPVSGGRGSDAHADFFAHKTITLPDMRQRFPLGKASSGTGATLGGIGGNIDHVHTVNPPNTTSTSNGAHDHGGVTGTPSDTVAATILAGGAASTTHTHSISSDGNHTHDVDIEQFNSGSANPPFIAVNFKIKI